MGHDRRAKCTISHRSPPMLCEDMWEHDYQCFASRVKQPPLAHTPQSASFHAVQSIYTICSMYNLDINLAVNITHHKLCMTMYKSFFTYRIPNTFVRVTPASIASHSLFWKACRHFRSRLLSTGKLQCTVDLPIRFANDCDWFLHKRQWSK